MTIGALMETPRNLENYWASVDDELGRFPARAVLETIPARSSEHFTVYGVRLTSVGPYRSFGYLSVPAGPGPFPALLQIPGYGSVNPVPDYNDRLRYVVLTVMHRGQRLADQPFAAAYPGLLTLAIDDAAAYVYRGIVADCLRGAEFLLGRAEVDKTRVGIAGNDVALLTAARRRDFTAVRVDTYLFYRALQARERTNAYPLEEINDYLRANPSTEEKLARTLPLFDPVHHAPAIQAPVLLSVGSDGALGDRAWLQPLSQALGDRAEHYLLTHESGTDDDEMDRWLAHQLRTEAMSRFRTMRRTT